MSDDERRNSGRAGWSPAGEDSASGASDREGPELDRLPPPAFPPGSRRRVPSSPVSVDAPADFPQGAFITPDEPIRRSTSSLDDALISPDDPIRHRMPREETKESEEEYGVATGIGDDGPVYARDHAFHQTGDAQAVREVAKCLEVIARDLRRFGTNSLTVGPEGPRLELMLKGLLSGYLLGSEEDPSG